MDDVAGTKEKQQPTSQSEAPRRKYMDQLQEVVDRNRHEVLIELDDIDSVRLMPYTLCRRLTDPVV